MATIKDKLRFNYDGVWSDIHGVMNINLDNGMHDETFISTRSLIETQVRGGNPLLHGLNDEPLQFEMVIAFKDDFNDGKIDSIIRWLFKDTYRPLYFEGKEDRVYYCMPVDDSRFVHTGTNKGYFTINMRCNSPYIYSPYITTNLETVTTSKTITIKNDGHLIAFPEISLKKVGAGTITIENLSDYEGRIFEVRDLVDQEDIYVNCEKEIIETDIIGTYRYDNVVGLYTRLLREDNVIKITGNCQVQFKYRKKYRF